LSRLSPVGPWSRLSARSQMVALFVLSSGLLAIVALASAGRPLRGGWGTTSPPRGKAHCTQVKNFNPVTGVQIPQYQCTYAPPTEHAQRALLIRLNPAAHRPCPLAHGDCSGFEGAVAAGPPIRGPSAGVVHGERLRQASGTTGDSWLLLAVGTLVGVVLLAVGVRWLVRWRRSTSGDDLTPTEENPAAAEERHAAIEEGALALAADDALGELRIAGDARQAIIGCYAQMERSLARAGMARRPSEAPLEYLARVLVSVAPAAGRVLTDLYERAMFSAKPMSDRDKERAIEALEALRGAAGGSSRSPV
jgi:Domain of unknown function (DUF4129)